MSASTNIDSFLSWFSSNGGSIDSSVGLAVFPGHGIGAVAKKDIPENHTLFTIPRTLTLSTRTSTLPELVGEDAWKEHRLNEGWVGLILCMMWEEGRDTSSPWCAYLQSLPEKFDTPMFWDENELKQLQGTSVVEKLGKDEAERDFNEKLIPAVQSRPDLFPASEIPKLYTLERYHIMGSRILSRSFNVEKWDPRESEDDVEEDENAAANTSANSGMDVDDEHGDSDSGEEDKDENDSSDVAMVPMADMLNAQWESENAKLFYEENELKMVSTKPIKSGEEILNTYGDLPNSELLRRYGHVDILPLPQGGEGNPGDVVEVRADLVVAVLSERTGTASLDDYKTRIEWWLEEGEDDTFVIESEEIPEAFIAMVRLLTFSSAEWEKIQGKGKVPKAKIDALVLEVVMAVIKRRLGEYSTTIEDDEKILSEPSVSNLNIKRAITVRLGEKRLLKRIYDGAEKALAEEKARNQNTGGQKRKGGREPDGKAKKSRRS